MKIGKIILIVLGAALIALSAKGLMEIPARTQVMQAAVYLEEPRVLPENEGKVVIIHGKPEMTRPVYDEWMGLTLQTVKAYRYTDVYTQTSAESNETKWEWRTKEQRTLLGEARMGDFDVDETLLTAFPAESHYTDFDPAETGNYNLTYPSAGSLDLYVLPRDVYYFGTIITTADDSSVFRIETESAARQMEGTAAYRYRHFDFEKNGEMTLAGVQQGNRIIADEDLGPTVYMGVKSKDEVISGSNTTLMIGSVVFALLGAALIFLGIRKPRPTTIKKEG